jgi:hypothetical protein
MMTVSHAVSGAFIAAALPNPLLYIPLCLACHYAEDFVYHWDIGTGMHKEGARGLKITFLLALFDALLAIALVAIFWRQTPWHFDLNIWFGAFFAILPDLIELPHIFLGKDFKILRLPEKWHDFVHRSTPNIWLGLLPQVIVILSIFLITRQQ